MAKLVFFDNDALLKIVQFDLMHEVLALLAIDEASCRVLATARYSLLPAQNRLKKCGDTAVASRLEAFLGRAKSIADEKVDAQALDALTATQGIDSGEALLIAAALSCDNSIVVTGDKRAIFALVSRPSLDEVCGKLGGRVHCLETLFALLVEADFAKVQEHVRKRPAVDKALTNIFGVSTPTSLESTRDGMRSYIEHLTSVAGQILVDPYP